MEEIGRELEIVWDDMLRERNAAMWHEGDEAMFTPNEVDYLFAIEEYPKRDYKKET